MGFKIGFQLEDKAMKDGAVSQEVTLVSYARKRDGYQVQIFFISLAIDSRQNTYRKQLKPCRTMLDELSQQDN